MKDILHMHDNAYIHTIWDIYIVREKYLCYNKAKARPAQMEMKASLALVGV